MGRPLWKSHQHERLHLEQPWTASGGESPTNRQDHDKRALTLARIQQARHPYHDCLCPHPRRVKPRPQPQQVLHQSHQGLQLLCQKVEFNHKDKQF